jgi:hypothetical protein
MGKTELKYTARQRKKIYLGALEILAEAGERMLDTQSLEASARFICCAISQVLGTDDVAVYEEFPEVYIFRCYERFNIFWLSDDNYCYSNTQTGNEFRQLVLLFAVELCDDVDFQNGLTVGCEK